MKIYHSIHRTLFCIVIFIFTMTACDDMYEIGRVEPTINVQESALAGPQTMRQVIPLTSSYPWFAEASAEWITMTRYRGQALKADSIVFSCLENKTMEDREGWIEVRLMDQLSQRIKLVQKGRGSLITLPQNLVYFNRQAGEVVIEVITYQQWQPEVSSKDGFTFTKVDNSHLKITAPENSTGLDRATSIKLVDKDRTTDATLSIIQKPTEKILFAALEKEKKDLILMKEETNIDIPVTLNVDYSCVPSASWMKVTSSPELKGNNVQNVTVSVEISGNQSGMERDGFIVIRNKGEVADASDTIFVSQRAKSQIIYVKPGGVGDGTSWDQAFGSVHDAMSASSNNGDMEIWVAAGEYQFKSTLTWKAVSLYGGFSGKETKFKDRNLKNKPVFLGGKFNFMNAWNNNGEICWMDGVVFADCDNYENTGTGCFEIYKNHGFRNCEFRNIRHGRAIGYFELCKMVNCTFYKLHSKNYLVRANNCQLYNVTIANGISDGWNSNYFHGGTKLYNALIWNIKIVGGSRDRAVVCGGDIPAINSAIMSGTNEKGLICTNCIELSADNNAADGPGFVNPEGDMPSFALRAESVCVDAGNSDYPGTLFDLIGNLRVAGSAVDIGAYEYTGK